MGFFVGDFFKYIVQQRVVSEGDARFYVANVMQALNHLHSLNIMYRDIKPEV